jgi:NAD(P)-dependent dehydrogenase (short-subunit alcohol dehydrogenase family)
VPASGGSVLPVPDLSGRKAVVTGAAHGIGLAIALRLRSVGATVIAVDNDEAALRAAFPEGECEAVLADVAADDPLALGDRLVRRHGSIPLVVNNVGITTPSAFLDLEPADFDLVFRTNLRGPWFLTRQLARALVAAETGGSILFVSSVHDTHIRLNPHYSSSKAAVAMLVKELAYELAPYRIRVNAVSPGWIKTEDGDAGKERALTARIPAGRPGQPDDVAGLAVVLLSDDLSDYVSGVNLTVDGGLSVTSWLTPQ